MSWQLSKQIKSSEDPELVRSFKGLKYGINKIRFNGNMKQIGSVDKGGNIMIYDFRGDVRPYQYNFNNKNNSNIGNYNYNNDINTVKSVNNSSSVLKIER